MTYAYTKSEVNVLKFATILVCALFFGIGWFMGNTSMLDKCRDIVSSGLPPMPPVIYVARK